MGDYVACGGQGAYHADVISVPSNLVVKVPENIDMKQAAFSTIASIAIQGIRQADLRMGENCLIIGMGLIGQLTYKILESSGMFPIGVDIDLNHIKYVKQIGLKNVYDRNTPSIETIIREFSNGFGTDAIIITAGTSSNDPIEFAGRVARKKAKVIIVGSVPTGFARKNYYKKELDLRMSSSYGPGRYDSEYEQKGHDYPIGYVRWTENRNMQSFVDLLFHKRLDISSLISHTIKLEDSINAYDMILSKNEKFSGIIIEYDKNQKPKKKIQNSKKSYDPDNVNLGVIGAGTFAQGFLLPNMKEKMQFHWNSYR